MNKVKDLTFWADNELQNESNNQSTSDHSTKDVITKNLEIVHGNSKYSRMNSNLSRIDENKIYQSPVLVKPNEINLSKNQDSFETIELSEVYLKYVKITGFCWLFCAITMIIMSYIGYTSPKQKSGYTCLRSVDVKKSYSESCTFTDECITSLGLKCSIINGNCT